MAKLALLGEEPAAKPYFSSFLLLNTKVTWCLSLMPRKVDFNIMSVAPHFGINLHAAVAALLQWIPSIFFQSLLISFIMRFREGQPLVRRAEISTLHAKKPDRVANFVSYPVCGSFHQHFRADAAGQGHPALGLPPHRCKVVGCHLDGI